MRWLYGLLFALPVVGQVHLIEGARIRPHVRFLSSDLLEGRGVGVRGGQLAVEYLAAQLEAAGLRVVRQEVPLVNVAPQPSAKLRASAGGKTEEFAWMTEFVGRSLEQTQESRFAADAVFAGHGITAPEFGWDDYGDVDVKGKVVVLFTNEPPSEDATFFGGRALTYYGRWTYKYEEALRRGAVAVILLHTTSTAGYGWGVVQGNGREQPQVRRKPGEPALALAGWMSADAGGRLLGLSQKSLDDLLKAADTRGFRASPLGIRIEGSIPSKMRELTSANVVGVAEGGDPVLRQEAIVFSAHWDHLGVGEAVNGDTIYNGAVDNATGCAMLLEMARAWMSMEPKPKRSALFAFVTSEESGLIGSAYYAANPLFPAGKTAANLNFDSFYPYGRGLDLVATGAERTTMWSTVQTVSKRFGLEILPDPAPEQGHFYRSDHFSFAKVGIPSFSVNMGHKFEGKTSEFGLQQMKAYNESHYHQPSDELKSDWNFAGMEQFARFGFVLGLEIANQSKLPSWAAGDEFLPAREKSLH